MAWSHGIRSVCKISTVPSVVSWDDEIFCSLIKHITVFSINCDLNWIELVIFFCAITMIKSLRSQTITGEHQPIAFTKVMIHHLCLDFIFIEIKKEMKLIVVCWNHLAWTGIVLDHQLRNASSVQQAINREISLFFTIGLNYHQWMIHRPKVISPGFQRELVSALNITGKDHLTWSKKVSWAGENHFDMYI